MADIQVVRTPYTVEEKTAGGVVVAYRAAAVIGNQAVHADKDTPEHRNAIRGLFLASGGLGDRMRLLLYGPVKNPAWSWTPDATVYIGSNGGLTQTRPSSGLVIPVGRADTATQISVRIGEACEPEERHVHAQEAFTLNGTDIANKYILLALTPLAGLGVQLVVEGAPGLRQATDYQMDGVNPKKLTWSGLALDGLLSSGDKLTVHYYRQAG